MSTRTRDILGLYNCFFITTTFNDWLHLFLNHKYYLIVINTMAFCLKKYDADVIVYVQIPNHIHLILFCNDRVDISGFMRDLKKYTSTKIRQMLEKDGRDITVEKLRYNKYGQKFKIWKDRFDAVIIRQRNVLLTKVKYIHNNPVRYGLVDKAEDWQYSSACFYKTGKKGLSPVKHAWDII